MHHISLTGVTPRLPDTSDLGHFGPRDIQTLDCLETLRTNPGPGPKCPDILDPHF